MEEGNESAWFKQVQDSTHEEKNTLERQGRLPLQITCETTLVADAMAKLAAWNI